jgi:glycosyltransferase involved in cell wall biosynthesis
MNITFINRMMGIKFGGGENFDLNMARALKKRGHNIKFVVGREWSQLALPMDENEFEVKYIKTPYLRDWHYKIKPTNFIKKVISVCALELDRWLFQQETFKYLKHNNWTDVYQLCGQPELGAKLGNIKSNNKSSKTVIWWPGIANKRKEKMISKCDVSFANGDAYKIIKDTIYPKIKHINLGIDIVKFHPIEKETKKVIEFLFVGRIVPVKNIPFMIEGFLEALKKNEDIILNIVGEGDKNEVIKVKELANNNLKIKFLGRKSGQELISAYQNSDVFILTSIYDNYPNVLFEAMACGLAVIGTNVGGIPTQIVKNKTGLLIESNNLIDLTLSILELADNKEKMKLMGRIGRERIENEFSWDKSAMQLESIYEDILEA